MRVLYLESFYGGSHRDVADGIASHSSHEIRLLTLPARFWKWRMRGAALSFARTIADEDLQRETDLIVSGGMMSVADLKALLPAPHPPVLLYAHETQLAYPAPQERESDLHFAFTDLVNMLAADHVAFNSNTHRNSYLAALPDFLRRLPEHRPMWSEAAVRERSSVCQPGIHCTASSAGTRSRVPPRDGGGAARHGRNTGEAPLILWNHRWEFDKNPEAFFKALRTIRKQGVCFRLALLGENFQAVPKVFAAAREEFADEIVHYGYVADRAAYESWLSRADIVVSTAIQENFGISVMEAMAHGAIPLLPNRLSYPEILPPEHHGLLYQTDDQLAGRCAEIARALGAANDRAAAREEIAPGLAPHARRFCWQERVHEFDALFTSVGTHHG